MYIFYMGVAGIFSEGNAENENRTAKSVNRNFNIFELS